jgi:iron complex outermembrane receptor protein
MAQHQPDTRKSSTVSNSNKLIFANASAIALITASPAFAQTAPPSTQVPAGPTGAAQTQQGANRPAPTPQSSADATTPPNSGEIVVTGTRVAGRSRLDTASPVDVLSANSLQHQGTSELGAAIANIAPSVDFPRPSATDATDAIRPATLRGLPPDEVLVLINNIRAHPSASLNVNSTVGRGSSAVDLNTIPTAALDRVEVLRDGASAQYGSDAIAGVINLRLRQARSGGSVSVTHGLYDTQVTTTRDSHHVWGEPVTTVQGWKGIGFGGDGYLTLSGEYQVRQPTNRSDAPSSAAVPAQSGPALRGRFGDPYVKSYAAFANAGTSIAPDWQLYGWLGYQHRHTSSAAFPRPNSTSAASGAGAAATAGYPFGFIPLIDTVSRDLNSAIGVKGIVGDGWNVGLSASYGRNKVSFRTEDSANYSLGAATPHDFYDGALIYDQLVGNFDVTKTLPVFDSLNVAFGLEARREGYQITPGELASYTGTGAQGFPGFGPQNAIKKHRQNGSAYLDVEAQFTKQFRVDAAVRGETYSDFGQVLTGKLSARYDVSHAFALRGTVSTGFRAPSLQQEYFTSVASVIVNGSPVLTGTFPSTAPVSIALGGLPLQPEKSTNYSLGTVIRIGGLDLTVDGYSIRLRNQLGLSENIQSTFSPAVANLLAPFNVSAARFFINGLASETKGIDAVAHYRLHSAGAGIFDFTLAGNVNKIKVTHVPTSTSTLNPAPTLFARNRLLTMTEGTPGEKVSGTVDWSLRDLGATARVTYYGDVNQPGTTQSADVHTGKHAITDLELRYAPKRGPQLAIGVQNLFDVYPNLPAPSQVAASGVVGFPFYSPFGFNGRYIYGRVGVNFGGEARHAAPPPPVVAPPPPPPVVEAPPPPPPPPPPPTTSGQRG